MTIPAGNLQSSVTWRKEKDNSIVMSSDSEIVFSPVTRRNAGLYSCVAENPLGLSKPAFVELDVKCEYRPGLVTNSILFC